MASIDRRSLAIIIVAAIILLYLTPALQKIISTASKWTILLGGGLLIGTMLIAPSPQCASLDDDS